VFFEFQKQLDNLENDKQRIIIDMFQRVFESIKIINGNISMEHNGLIEELSLMVSATNFNEDMLNYIINIKINKDSLLYTYDEKIDIRRVKQHLKIKIIEKYLKNILIY